MDQIERGAIPNFIRRLMPGATEPELRSATETFRQYMAAVLRIHTRLQREALPVDSRESQS